MKTITLLKDGSIRYYFRTIITGNSIDDYTNEGITPGTYYISTSVIKDGKQLKFGFKALAGNIYGERIYLCKGKLKQILKIVPDIIYYKKREPLLERIGKWFKSLI